MEDCTRGATSRVGSLLGVGVNFNPKFSTSSSALVRTSSERLTTVDDLFDARRVERRGPEIMGLRIF